MKHSSQTFNFHRLTLFLKCYIGENKRNLLIFATLMLTLPTLLVCIGTWLGQDVYDIQYPSYYDSDYDPQHWMVAFVCFSQAYLFAMTAGSRVFSALSTKHSRLNFFTTPASTLEKYIALTIVYVAGYALLMFISVNMANIIRVGLFGHMSNNLLMVPFPEMMGRVNYSFPYRSMVLIWSTFAVSISIFTVGSVLWPHNSFIKTLVAIIALSIIIGSLTTSSIVYKAVTLGSVGPRFEWMDSERAIMNLVIIGNFISSIACMVFAYFRLKEWEVISRW
ncbi:MAG: hypothetical protein J1E84_00400 [Muribaculaceae bacterium]|nr:hypothetical protein [Muribaculaceae bacterium]